MRNHLAHLGVDFRINRQICWHKHAALPAFRPAWRRQSSVVLFYLFGGDFLMTHCFLMGNIFFMTDSILTTENVVVELLFYLPQKGPYEPFSFAGIFT